MAPILHPFGKGEAQVRRFGNPKKVTLREIWYCLYQTMPIPDRPQFLAAIPLLLTAAFVASGWIKPPYDIWWRRAVIIGYLFAIGLILVWVTKWLMEL
jgi:hypothetical protein